jgi:hypothetical protein
VSALGIAAAAGVLEPLVEGALEAVLKLNPPKGEGEAADPACDAGAEAEAGVGVKLKPPAGFPTPCSLAPTLEVAPPCSRSKAGSALISTFLASLSSSRDGKLEPFSATLTLRSKRGREVIEARRASSRTERAGGPFEVGTDAGAEALGAGTGWKTKGAGVVEIEEEGTGADVAAGAPNEKGADLGASGSFGMLFAGAPKLKGTGLGASALT